MAPGVQSFSVTSCWYVAWCFGHCWAEDVQFPVLVTMCNPWLSLIPLLTWRSKCQYVRLKQWCTPLLKTIDPFHTVVSCSAVCCLHRPLPFNDSSHTEMEMLYMGSSFAHCTNRSPHAKLRRDQISVVFEFGRTVFVSKTSFTDIQGCRGHL